MVVAINWSAPPTQMQVIKTYLTRYAVLTKAFLENLRDVERLLQQQQQQPKQAQATAAAQQAQAAEKLLQGAYANFPSGMAALRGMGLPAAVLRTARFGTGVRDTVGLPGRQPPGGGGEGEGGPRPEGPRSAPCVCGCGCAACAHRSCLGASSSPCTQRNPSSPPPPGAVLASA